jgi:hypothetical protein
MAARAAAGIVPLPAAASYEHINVVEAPSTETIIHPGWGGKANVTEPGVSDAP